MHDSVVAAWSAAWDVLGEDGPAAVESVAEPITQGVEVARNEVLELLQILHMTIAKRELAVAQLDDPLRDALVEDPPPDASLHWRGNRLVLVFAFVARHLRVWRG